MKAKRIGLMAALLTGALLAAAPALSQAQDAKKDARPRPDRPAFGQGQQERLDKLAEELKLTDEQKKKVAEVFKNRAEKMRQIREDSSLSQEQRREKFRAAFEESNKQMKGILTSEQYEKWIKMRPQAPGQGRGGPPRRPRGDESGDNK